MAITIQKLSDIVNILDSTATAGEQIIKSLDLDSTAKVQLKQSPVPDNIQVFDADGNQTATIAIKANLSTQDEGGTPQLWTGTNDELINKLNNDYFVVSSGSAGPSNVTIVGDTVGLAKEAQFNYKYTGYVIDLQSPDTGTFPSFPFDIDEVNLSIGTQPGFEISSFGHPYEGIENTKELAEYFNCIQNYFYFVEVGPTLLGVMAGKLPVFDFTEMVIDAGLALPLKYEFSSFTYQTATEDYSTVDKILLSINQNAQKQNAPKGLATMRLQLGFSASPIGIADVNPYREELIIRNGSASSNLYIGYGDNTTTTDFTFILEPSKSLLVTAGHRVTALWETGATSGTILITESI